LIFTKAAAASISFKKSVRKSLRENAIKPISTTAVAQCRSLVASKPILKERAKQENKRDYLSSSMTSKGERRVSDGASA
jgi:hypothetical protein